MRPLRMLSGSLVTGLLLSSCRTIMDAQTLPLKTDGEVRCEIVVPSEAGPVAAFAGNELRTFLSQALGADVPLRESPTPGTLAIVLGSNRLAAEAGIEVDDLPRDAFVIRAVGDRIFIAGRDCMKTHPAKSMQTRSVWAQFYERGTLFGVYEFLERFVGVRFYFPGDIGTVVPGHEVLRVPADVDIVDKPDKIVRAVVDGVPGTRFPANWFDKDREIEDKNLNKYRLRLETQIVPKCHGLAGLGYIQRFAASNPEYFALMTDGRRHNDLSIPHPGQLCFSSGIREEIYRDAEAYLTGQPASSRGIKTRYGEIWDPSHFQPGYFNIMPQDSFYECRCTECQVHFSQGAQTTSDLVWGMVIETALRLKKNGIPGKLVMMSYPPYTLPPSAELPDNVLVFVAVNGPGAHRIPHAWEEQHRRINEWNRICGDRVALWTSSPSKYGRRFVPGIPPMMPEAMGAFCLQNTEILGAFLCADMDEYIYNYLNYYLFAKLMWDSSLAPGVLIAEHDRLMFGPAAAEMRAVYARFEFLWNARIAGDVRETSLGAMIFPPSTYQLWEEIYSPSEIAAFDARFDRAEELTANEPAARQRVRFMRRHLLDPVNKERNNYLETKQEIEDLKVYVRELTADEKINLDGDLNESAWAEAESIFLRPALKDADKPCAVHTIVRILRNKDHLYIAFECEEPDMARISASAREFDDQDIWRDSSVEMFLNPSADRERYVQLLLNASGALSDLSWRRIGGGGEHDWSWNSDARTAVRQGETGWTAEVAVPIGKLEGFNPDGFPANFTRNRVLVGADTDYVRLFSWSPFLVNSFQEVDRFGSLVFRTPADDNLIRNGNFTGKVTGRYLGGWSAPQPETIQHGESWALATDRFVTGGKSLLLSCPEGGNMMVTQYLPELKPDTEYLLTFFIRAQDVVPTKPGGGAVVNLWDDKNRWFPENWYTGTMPWTKQGFRLRTGPETNNETQSYIRLRLMNAAGTVWFDDVRLRPVGE